MSEHTNAQKFACTNPACRFYYRTWMVKPTPVQNGLHAWPSLFCDACGCQVQLLISRKEVNNEQNTTEADQAPGGRSDDQGGPEARGSAPSPGEGDRSGDLPEPASDQQVPPDSDEVLGPAERTLIRRVFSRYPVHDW